MNKSEFVIISQARMTSTRLPGKILKEVADQTLLGYHIDRLKKTGIDIVVATTVNADDDAVLLFCETHDITCIRGSEDDVLDRFVSALKLHPAKYFIRVTSDCPFIDSGLIIKGVEEFIRLNDESVYLSNCFPRTFARGFDFEMASSQMLIEAHQITSDVFDREHVTPYLWKNKSGRVKMHNISQEADQSTLRVCVDTQEDFELIKILISRYNADLKNHSEIESILINNPELIAINAMVEQKKSQ